MHTSFKSDVFFIVKIVIYSKLIVVSQGLQCYNTLTERGAPHLKNAAAHKYTRRNK